MEAIIILSLLGLVLMISGVYGISKQNALYLTMVGLVSALIYNVTNWELEYSLFNDMLIVNNYGVAFGGTIIASLIGLLLVSEYHFKNIENYFTEHLSLMVFSVVGMLCMVSFDNLVMLFVGIEIMSVSIYILVGSRKKDLASNEASLKYFLMGAFTTGILLMGITLLFGATNSFYLSDILTSLQKSGTASPLFIAGMFFILVALFFKVSAAPFHFWTADVYQGAPSLVSAFMSGIVKVAGFAAFYRLFYICFTPVSLYWVNIVWVVAALTITVGSISAVNQSKVKRLLAFSSVSHAGYLLITILTEAADSDLLFYSVSYSIATILAFAVLMVVESEIGSTDISAFNGLVKKNATITVGLTIALASMAGIPLTAGFFAKFFVLKSAVLDNYIYLVVIAIVNAIIGIYYYFKVIISMYFTESEDSRTIHISGLYVFSIYFGAVLLIILGLFPDVLYNLV